MKLNLRNLTTATLLAAGAGLALAASPSGAEEVRIVYGGSSTSTLTIGSQTFAEEIEARTDGRYTGRIFYGSLLNYAETIPGLRDGITDVGFVIPAYERAEFPQANLMVDLATIGTDPIVLAGAASEYLYSCEACIQEYLDHNQVPLGYSAIGPYFLMSKPKIEAMDDFAAKTFRGFGPFGRWAEAMGAKGVVLSANDVYEALSQGQIDGNIHSPDVLRSLSIGEVTDYLLNAPIGVFMGNALFNTNRDFWNTLSEEDKKAFLLAAGKGHAVATVQYYQNNMAIVEDPTEHGVELLEPTEEIAAATAKFREDDLQTVAAMNRDTFGVADAEERVARLREIVEKWEGLVEGIDKNDAEAVAELYNREVFSKVDPSTLN